MNVRARALPGFVDHLAAPTGIYTVRLRGCPACGGVHEVALARMTGRFMYRCGRTECSGEIDGWAETRRRWEATEGADRVLLQPVTQNS